MTIAILMPIPKNIRAINKLGRSICG